MRFFYLLCFCAALLSGRDAAASEIDECYTFSNKRYSDKLPIIHVYGLDLTIWRVKEDWEGSLSYECGLQGEPVRAKLRKLRVHKNGKVSFESKWSHGTVHDAKSKKWVPAKGNHSIIFEGLKGSKAISGKLEGSSCNENIPEKIQITSWDKRVCKAERNFYDKAE